MSGVKGKSGGARKGAGRKPAPTRPRYIRPVVLAPSNLLEQRATQWYLKLDPKTRLESIVEDFSFQPEWGEYQREIESLDGRPDRAGQ